ncbi:Hypothetical predicted protein [Xyrichtys novacula]|uniref:Uncharacterized protein n=1 Tax=Xyrichtys novacula TaxID=13765 RepID=A0AAV1ELW9_XYRNO|nr:Hypothetical predicted protein [Xyrichtys novacula]
MHGFSGYGGTHSSPQPPGSRHAQTQNMPLNNTLRLEPAKQSRAKRSCGGSGQPSISASSPAEPRCLTTQSEPPGGRQLELPLPPHAPSSPGSYLKLAGDFTWMFRPGGGLLFLFSRSAMPPS